MRQDRDPCDEPVIGIIPLDGASLSREREADGRDVIRLTTPARRLSWLTGRGAAKPLAAEARARRRRSLRKRP